jgi:glycosyltransferase involved in cell wall biosynthesis
MHIVEIEVYGRGGLAHYAYNLSLALAERGHNVTLITNVAYELENHCLTPRNLRVAKQLGRLSQGTQAWLPRPLQKALVNKIEAITDGYTILRKTRSLRPDLVHLHLTNSIALFYLFLLRRLGIPVVFTVHNVTPHEKIHWQKSILKSLYRQADLLIAHSEVDATRLEKEFSHSRDHTVVIPHGSYGFFASGVTSSSQESARRALKLAPDDEVVLFFGYIREYKGLDVLLDAWPSVVAARPRARLLVAGDPLNLPTERRVELESQLRAMGAIVHFSYIPFDHVVGYFQAADTLVMPYRKLSQSGVLFLGLSMGLPVVATAVGGLPETLTDGESALLVPPESAELLAHAVIRVLAEPVLRSRLEAGGLRVCAHHGWESIAVQTERAFFSLMEDRKRSKVTPARTV